MPRLTRCGALVLLYGVMVCGGVMLESQEAQAQTRDWWRACRYNLAACQRGVINNYRQCSVYRWQQPQCNRNYQLGWNNCRAAFRCG